MYKPNCEKPLLLINRAALNYAFQGGVPHGSFSYLVRSCLPDKFPFGKVLKSARLLDDAELDKNFVIYKGHSEPLFVYVPCNKCVVCRERKRNELIFRSDMESCLYDTPPYFITLTYHPCMRPPHGELRYKDVQDFFKRLRKRFAKKGLPTNFRQQYTGN